MPQLRLQTLGSLQAGRSGEAEAVFHGGKACLFLAVLAVTPDEWVPRDHLTRLLWPSSSQSHGRQSLRQLLSTIRKNLSEEALVEGPEGLRLDPSHWWIDCWEFERALEEERWADAAEAYLGPFGGRAEPNGSAELRALIDSIQARMHTQAEDCFSGLIAQALDVRDMRAAESWARRFVAVDPLNEHARLLLIETLGASDRYNDAFAVAEEYRVLLEELVGDVPSSKLQQLADRARFMAMDPRYEYEAEAPDEGEQEGTRQPGREQQPDDRERPTWTGSAGSFGRWVAAGVVLVVAVAAVLLVASPWSSAPRQGLSLLATALGPEGGRVPVRLELSRSGARTETIDPTGGVPDPSGRYLVQGEAGADGPDLVVRSALDGTEILRRANALDERFLAWAPDGGALVMASIVFSGDLAGSYERIGVLTVPGGDYRTVEDLDARQVAGASWSPTGTVIVASAATTESADHDLHFFTPDGRLRALLDRPGDQLWPTWSPSGTWIAFESVAQDDYDIHLLGAADSVPVVLASGPLRQRSPRWMRDTLLVFLQGEGSRTELHAVNPFAEAASRVLTIDTILVELDPFHHRVNAELYVDHVEAIPARVRTSVNAMIVPRLIVSRASGDHVPPDSLAVTWTSSAPEVVGVRTDGTLRTLGLGRAEVTASLEGWRSAVIQVDVLPLKEVGAPLLLREDWSEGIDPRRWLSFGDPLPYSRPTGFPGGGGVFVNNGDANYHSGVVSADPLDLSDGLTVEYWAAQPLNGQHFRGLQVSLADRPTTGEEGAPLRGLALEQSGQPTLSNIAWYRTNSFNQEANILIGSAGYDEELHTLPLPADVERWHRYVMQLDSTGLLTLMIDGEPEWRGRSGYDFALPDSAFVVLLGRSLDTEVMLGPLTVYRGLRYELDASFR